MLEVNILKPRIVLYDANHTLSITAGQSYRIYCHNFDANADFESILIQNMDKYLNEGDDLSIDDGKLQFTVDALINNNFYIVVAKIDGKKDFISGIVSNKSQLFFNRTPLSFCDLTSEINFAIKNDFDYICLSYIHSVEEIRNAKKLLAGSRIRIFSKIETKASLANFDEIVSESDGILYSFLGVIIDREILSEEVPIAKLPNIQKIIVNGCLILGKPLFITGRVIESLVEKKSPNRSEVSDIFNCIGLGITGFVLSTETSSSTDPLRALLWITKLCKEAELQTDSGFIQGYISKILGRPIPISESIASSTGLLLS